ncbi:hypothetical protein [Alkalibacillus aidingensis]|nr:hypothetical protein [Alkalibacillus aidingensis]
MIKDIIGVVIFEPIKNLSIMIFAFVISLFLVGTALYFFLNQDVSRFF